MHMGTCTHVVGLAKFSWDQAPQVRRGQTQENSTRKRPPI